MKPCLIYRTILNKNQTLLCFLSKEITIFAIQEDECFCFPDKITKGFLTYREGNKKE